jgi:pyrimidine operon attenuation protein / uracil phosphoribosyltransferase
MTHDGGKEAMSAAGPSQGANAPQGGSEVRAATSVGALFLDAEALYKELLRGVQTLCNADTRLVGITSGGAWLVERLQRDLGLSGKPGVISSAMHRDDFAKRGLSSSAQTQLPFDVNGAHILILDDVLYTGRTLRAVINELYDYGRPASVKLAVLVDRGGRELPVQADFAAARVALGEQQSLALARAEDGSFRFEVKEK